MEMGKGWLFFYWEWGHNSAARDRQIILCKKYYNNKEQSDQGYISLCIL